MDLLENEDNWAYGGWLDYKPNLTSVRSAVESATELALGDIDLSRSRFITFGGPQAPWTTPQAKALRALGVPVHAAAGCSVTVELMVFVDVYEAITTMQWISSVKSFKSDVLSVCSNIKKNPYGWERLTSALKGKDD